MCIRYHQRKSAERIAKRKVKKAEGEAKKAVANEDDVTEGASATAAYEPGMILGVSGLKDDTTREDIKAAFESHATVSWVDFQRGDTAGEVSDRTASCL